VFYRHDPLQVCDAGRQCLACELERAEVLLSTVLSYLFRPRRNFFLLLTQCNAGTIFQRIFVPTPKRSCSCAIAAAAKAARLLQPVISRIRLTRFRMVCSDK
jgi:hypothetical protein